MRMKKDELINKISEYELSDDIKISLLEDVSDSIDDESIVSDLQKTIEEITKERDDIKQKYINRFKNDSIKLNENANTLLEDVKEKNYIDVTSI